MSSFISLVPYFVFPRIIVVPRLIDAIGGMRDTGFDYIFCGGTRYASLNKSGKREI